MSSIQNNTPPAAASSSARKRERPEQQGMLHTEPDIKKPKESSNSNATALPGLTAVHALIQQHNPPDYLLLYFSEQALNNITQETRDTLEEICKEHGDLIAEKYIDHIGFIEKIKMMLEYLPQKACCFLSKLVIDVLQGNQQTFHHFADAMVGIYKKYTKIPDETTEEKTQYTSIWDYKDLTNQDQISEDELDAAIEDIQIWDWDYKRLVKTLTSMPNDYSQRRRFETLLLACHMQHLGQDAFENIVDKCNNYSDFDFFYVIKSLISIAEKNDLETWNIDVLIHVLNNIDPQKRNTIVEIASRMCHNNISEFQTVCDKIKHINEDVLLEIQDEFSAVAGAEKVYQWDMDSLIDTIYHIAPNNRLAILFLASHFCNNAQTDFQHIVAYLCNKQYDHMDVFLVIGIDIIEKNPSMMKSLNELEDVLQEIFKIIQIETKYDELCQFIPNQTITINRFVFITKVASEICDNHKQSLIDTVTKIHCMSKQEIIKLGFELNQVLEEESDSDS